MTTKREAQAALDELRRAAGVGFHVSDPLQSLIDAMPDDPESRAERLGRIAYEAYMTYPPVAKCDWPAIGRERQAPWIAAAAAVAEECKPREVTPGFLPTVWHAQGGSWKDIADRINRYVRGEDA